MSCVCLYNFEIMQISENLLRVIFMLSTIVAVTDCCSSRLLLLKEHTLQIVQQHNLQNVNSADYDYDNEDYDLLQQQHQQQKIPQYVEIVKSELEFNKNYTDEHTRSRDENEEKSTDTQISGGTIQLGNFGSESFESLLGIFDAAAFDTTLKTTTTTTTASSSTTTTTSTAITSETTSPKQSITSMTEESSTQRDSSDVVDGESDMETSSTTVTTSTASETTNAAAAKLVSGVESVMNDLKSARDLLSLPCSGQFNTEFCLNRGRCFRYPIGNDTIHSCICEDGYIGERCESKSMNGSFIPSIAGANKKQKILMARIVFSFPMLVALSVIYIMIGAAVVFKRPAPPTPATLARKEPFELLPDEDAGEFIMMNSYTMAAGAASFSAYTD